MSRPDPSQARAQRVLASLRSGTQLETEAPLSLPEAYALTAELRALRRAEGEIPVGRKIGFTNRTIWPEYGVYAPIWGDMYDTTVRELPPPGQPVSLLRLMEPRIEPEIAFRLSHAPNPGMDEAALLACVDWVSHAFEIVQSPYPGWEFTAAAGVAGAGLHGVLLLGPPRSIENAAQWLAGLRDFSVELFRGAERVDTGHAGNVLDGPLSALRHLIAMLAQDRVNPALAAGEIVTTGTLTRAFPVAPGEHWSTRVHGLPLEGISVTFT